MQKQMFTGSDGNSGSVVSDVHGLASLCKADVQRTDGFFGFQRDPCIWCSVRAVTVIVVKKRICAGNSAASGYETVIGNLCGRGISSAP